MAKALIESLDFLKALAFAKDAAVAAGIKELNSVSLLLGFAQAVRSVSLSGKYPALEANLDAIESIASTKGLRLPSDLSKPKSPNTLKMPLEKKLKDSLTPIERPAELINVLLDAVLEGRVRKSSVEHLLETIQSEDGFAVSNHYAHHLAHRHEMKEISAEVLAAGAYIALRKGELSARPAISSHLRTSRQALEMLFEKRGWDISHDNYARQADLELVFPLGAWVSELERPTAQGANPFAASINLGIRAANKLVMQKRVAYHEAGHAVLTSVLQPSKSISKITILDEAQDDGADGYVAYDLSSPYYEAPDSRDSVLQSLCISLAGRVSEQRQYGHNEIDAGATGDLADATEQAWRAITVFGLDFDFGPVSLDVLQDKGNQKQGWLFDEAQKRLQAVMKEALLTTETLVDIHWRKIEAVALVLSEKKVLTEDDMVRIMAAEPSGHEPA